MPCILKPVLFCKQVRFAGIDCSGAALDMAKAALLGSCEGLAACNITLVCKEYTQGGPRPAAVSAIKAQCSHVRPKATASSDRRLPLYNAD